MGKKQHSKDRLFITRTEWNTEWGGYKEKKTVKRQLPFYCCALSLQPFDHPYCSKDGYVFDLTAILPYVKKHKSHPITGQPLSVKDLIKLKFSKNDDDEYHCPITRKIFNKSSHIVAVSKTGNVYSYDAVKQLNINKNDYHDLVDNTPFTPNDIITIQNPQDPSKQYIENFAHIARAKPGQHDNDENDEYKIDDDNHNKHSKASDAKQQSNVYINPELITNHAQIRHTSTTKRVFAQIKEESKKQGPPSKKMKLSSSSNGDRLAKNKPNEYGLYNNYTTGRMAASFTSTMMTPVFKDEFQPYTEEQIRAEIWRNVKGGGKKGYVQLVTNMGNLNFLLDCDYAPKTCYNFLKHCENGYYDNTIFHRNIMSFMIQGGDPEGTGHGGKCAWDTATGKFEDEFHKFLKHNERGVIAMANSGPNTNGSQFYIIYQAQPHLDDKHSVFGRLVGGMNVLNRMEEVPVNPETDRPLKVMKILKTNVFQNPFNDPLPSQIKAEQEEKEKELRKLNQEKGRFWSNPAQEISKLKSTNTHNDGDGNTFQIGKYLKDKVLQTVDHKKSQKKKRKTLTLPNPTNQDEKHKKVTQSVFRFKSFEMTKK
eukprot:CAMPEP_0197076744 /NCGR_PEP_ID=MMETSP1384-20130603/212269_1 /TAXON_ID=29189 /ORGANISM="Ammonia sp." /LENGTH=593 /DNA_ID=CAMNT_0042515603 /DNA_START=15 /DNA_END=1796 /DNA_ORIENTATION=-